MAFDAGAIVGKLRLDKKKWDSAIGKVRADSKSLQGAILRNSQQIKRMGMAVTAVGVGIGLVFRKIVKDSIGYGLQLDKIAKQTAMTTAEFSKLAYAAEQEHASMEGLTKCIPIMAKYMEYARQGQETYTREFDKMGIAVTDATGRLKSTYTVLLEMADYYKTAENKTQALAIATTLLGRRGADLVPLLKLGREGIEELGNEAEELGIVMETKTAAAMKAFDDKLTTIKYGLKGVGIAITEALLPSLDKLADKVKKMGIKIVAFIKDHQDLFKTLVALTAAFGGLALVIGPLLMLLPGITAAAVGLGIGLGPLILIIGGVAAAIGLVILVIQNWRTIILFLEKAWLNCVIHIQKGINDILIDCKAMVDMLAKLPGKLGAPFKVLSEKIGDTIGALEGKTIAAKERLARVMQEMADNAKASLDDIKDKVEENAETIKNTWGNMTNDMRYMFGTCADDIKSMGQLMKESAENAAKGTGDAFETMSNRISGTAIELTTTLSDTFGNFFELRKIEIENDMMDAINAENAKYEADKAGIEKDIVDEAEKATALEELETKHQKALDKIREDAKEKETAARQALKPFMIAQAIANTAQGATKALAQWGWPLGFIMAALATAAGLAQVGIIKAQKFQRGGFKPKGVWGIAGEAGPEMVTRPTLLSPEMEAQIIPMAGPGMGTGQIIVRANFYGDIRTEADFELIAKKLGDKVKSAIRGD